MRLDKLIVSTGVASRTQVSRAAKRGEVLVNGAPERHADRQVDPDTDKYTIAVRRLFTDSTHTLC